MFLYQNMSITVFWIMLILYFPPTLPILVFDTLISDHRPKIRSSKLTSLCKELRRFRKWQYSLFLRVLLSIYLKNTLLLQIFIDFLTFSPMPYHPTLLTKKSINIVLEHSDPNFTLTPKKYMH